MYGWSAVEAIGQSVQELLHSQYPVPFSEIEATIYRTGWWEGEIEHQRRDGSRIVVASRWALQRDKDGEPRAILEINTDITVQKKAIEALRRAHAQLEKRVQERTAELAQANKDLRQMQERFIKAFRGSPDALMICKLKDSTILEVNYSWISLFGYALDEVIGRNSNDLNLFVDVAERDRVVALLKDRDSLRNLEVIVRWKSGDVRIVLLSVELIDIKDESCMLMIMHDVTRRKRMEEDLREREMTLRSFYDSSPILMGISEDAGDDVYHVYDNPAACRFFGRERESTAGKLASELDARRSHVV